MVHSIAFKKRCNNCFQTDGIKKIITIIDYGGDLLKGFKKRDAEEYDKDLVLNFIKTDEKDKECEFCTYIDSFVYYDLEVDNFLLENHSDLIIKNEKKLIENDSTVIFFGVKIELVKLSINHVSDEDKFKMKWNLLLGKLSKEPQVNEAEVHKVECEKLNCNNPEVQITKKQAKIVYSYPDSKNPHGVSTAILFVGHITKIEYDAADQIKKMKGVVFLDLYGGDVEQDFFTLTRNMTNIYNSPVNSHKNIYVEVWGVKYQHEAIDKLKQKLNNYLIELK